MESTKRFIIIDDDKLNNKICTALIEKLFPDAHVNAFTSALDGFNYIKSQYAIAANEVSSTLFLDIKMPEMDAWGFLEIFEGLPVATKEKVKVYILSSSVDKRDMERAKANPNVVYYLIKPLTRESISLITHAQKKRDQQK